MEEERYEIKSPKPKFAPRRSLLSNGPRIANQFLTGTLDFRRFGYVPLHKQSTK
jgi:hypothetical protein